ncbi:MAG: putative toxin-antitoxin system toxin component, PIN family [Anaerolineales bacterium]
MIKVVIDTNVLVSAILRDKDPETVILYIAEQPDFEWIVSPEILTEYKEVLGRKKFDLPEALKQHWFRIFDELTTLIGDIAELDFPRDQKDAKFLACAISGEVHYFITGDKDFVEAKKMHLTTILSVSQFKRLVMC